MISTPVNSPCAPAAGCRVTAAKPLISFSHSCKLIHQHQVALTVSIGCRGWVYRQTGQAAVSSLIFGLYFIVHEPSG